MYENFIKEYGGAFKKTLQKKYKKMGDGVLLDEFRSVIEIKETIKNEIIHAMTIHISGEDETFISEIDEALSCLKKEILELNSFGGFDAQQLIFHVIRQELQSRRYELVKIINEIEPKQKIETIAIHMVDPTGKEFEVNSLFLLSALDRKTLIKKLDLSVRTINGLDNYGIKTLGELIDRWKYSNIKNFYGIKDLGKKSYVEVEDFLGKHNLLEKK